MLLAAELGRTPQPVSWDQMVIRDDSNLGAFDYTQTCHTVVATSDTTEVKFGFFQNDSCSEFSTLMMSPLRPNRYSQTKAFASQCPFVRGCEETMMRPWQCARVRSRRLGMRRSKAWSACRCRHPDRHRSDWPLVHIQPSLMV